ncbi:MAG: hypothetical protein IPG69_16665 [Flavobacteriales bacterium]|nr:hypothetical protein [Flavobacteriales bacterium]
MNLLRESSLAEAFDLFKLYLHERFGGAAFQNFEHHGIDLLENYKKTVYREARAELKTQFWKPEHIGTGSIQADVVRAIATEVVHNGRKQQNNLDRLAAEG